MLLITVLPPLSWMINKEQHPLVINDRTSNSVLLKEGKFIPDPKPSSKPPTPPPPSSKPPTPITTNPPPTRKPKDPDNPGSQADNWWTRIKHLVGF
jgi:hypothetical protein